MSLIPTIAFSSTPVYNNNPFAGLHSYNFSPMFVTFSSSRITCSQVRTLKFLEPSREMPLIRVFEGKKIVLDFP